MKPNDQNLLFKLLAPFSDLKRTGVADRFPIADEYRTSISLVKNGAVIPTHSHEEDNFNYVFDGEFVVTIEGQTKTYGKGDWFFIGADQEHSAVAKTSVDLLEFWIKGRK